MIDGQLAAFLQEGLGIYLGTRDERLRPNGARAIAIAVEDDGRQLAVHLAEVAAARILPDLESNGQAAVSFGRPVDDRACQVKGVFIDSRATTQAERQLVETQWDGFLRQLEHIGFSRDAASDWVLWPAVAIRLRVTAVFEQTPGPHAGTPIA